MVHTKNIILSVMSTGILLSSMSTFSMHTLFQRSRTTISQALQSRQTKISPRKISPRTQQSMRYSSHTYFDPYKTLEIDRSASPEDTKKAFHEKAKIYHADKNLEKTDEEKKANEEKMKQLNRAYSMLKSKNKNTASGTQSAGTWEWEQELDSNGLPEHYSWTEEQGQAWHANWKKEQQAAYERAKRDPIAHQKLEQVAQWKEEWKQSSDWPQETELTELRKQFNSFYGMVRYYWDSSYKKQYVLWEAIEAIKKSIIFYCNLIDEESSRRLRLDSDTVSDHESSRNATPQTIIGCIETYLHQLFRRLVNLKIAITYSKQLPNPSGALGQAIVAQISREENFIDTTLNHLDHYPNTLFWSNNQPTSTQQLMKYHETRIPEIIEKKRVGVELAIGMGPDLGQRIRATL